MRNTGAHASLLLSIVWAVDVPAATAARHTCTGTQATGSLIGGWTHDRASCTKINLCTTTTYQIDLIFPL